MAKPSHEKILSILVVTCLFLIDIAVGGRTITDLEIRKQLRRLNKPAVKSIKSEDGDIIDCVDIYKQPAFEHPLLKNHSIQMRPSNYDSKRMYSSKPLEQLWHKSGSCPKGTIPILRTQKSDLLRAVSLNAVAPAMESAKLYVEGENHGGEASINVWNVNVEPGESSTASVFVARKGKPDLINAGWMVSGSVFGDNQTRTYGFWASDNGGCYNLKCSGFVQTSQTQALGAAISPLSIYFGDQYDIHVRISKELDTENWWLEHNYEPVGYWPGSLFKNMANGADLVQWGGQVWNTAPGGHHTSTQMGSGHFSAEGQKKAAFFNTCLLLNDDNSEITPFSFSAKATKPGCYDISKVVRNYPGLSFFYGGPGGPGCDE